MNWLKILLALLTVAFCLLLGYFAASKYRARKKFFGQFSAFNQRYLNELSYARKPLNDFLKQYPYTGEFGKSVEEFYKSRCAKWNYPFLSGDEQSLCADYFQMLGRGDARSQEAFFTAQEPVLKTKKEESEKESKSRGELYLKLGLLAGLAIVILIV